LTTRVPPLAVTRFAHEPSRRRGVALMMTLGAIAVIGALIVGVLFSALLERRAAMEQLLRARALDAAELALAATIAPTAWDSSWSAAPTPGIVANRSYSLPAPDVIDSVRIAKLSSRFFLVIADARVGLSPLAFARRRLSLIVVLDSAQHPAPARSHAWLELTR
jgi:type II secretory pathway component PulK